MNQRTAAIVVMVGGAVVAIGSFLPWASIATGLGSASIDGITGDGKITVVLGGVIALLGLLAIERPVSVARSGAMMLLGVAAVAFGVWEYSNVQAKVDDVASDVVRASVGTGLYLVIAGGVIAIVGAALLPRPTATIPPPA